MNGMGIYMCVHLHAHVHPPLGSSPSGTKDLWSPLPLPLGKKVPACINQEEKLILGFLAVARVQVMFQWDRTLQRADHIDFLPLDPPVESKNTRLNISLCFRRRPFRFPTHLSHALGCKFRTGLHILQKKMGMRGYNGLNHLSVQVGGYHFWMNQINTYHDNRWQCNGPWIFFLLHIWILFFRSVF